MNRWFPVYVPALLSSPLWLPIGSTSTASTPSLLEDEMLQSPTLVFQRTVATPSAAIPAAMFQARGISRLPSADKDRERYHYGLELS